jgi:branched-chain amino acid transport system permease protein
MNAAIAQFFASYSNIIDLCLLNSLIAYGLFLALSANMFSLATGGFMALGAYCSVYMTMELGLPFASAVLAGAILGAAAAALIGTPVLRLRGDYFMLATFAFTEVIRVVALNWDAVTGGALGIVNIPRYTQTWHLALALIVVVYVVHTLRGCYFGRAIAAIKQDDVVAQTMGVNVFAYRLSLFVASGFICGAAGALAAHLNYFVGPGDFGLVRSVDALTYPILGGVNALAGPVVGAVFTTILPEALRFSNQLREILMGALVVAVVLYLPDGALSVLKLRWRSGKSQGGKSQGGNVATATPRTER